MSKKLTAEVLGTFILVFFGCGAAAIAGPLVGYTGIALAFGISIVAAAYGFGAISGAHLTPAVSLGFVAAGRMSVGDFIGYAIAQIVGATTPEVEREPLLLDVGSGTGQYSATCLDRLPTAFAVGIDLSKACARSTARAHPRLAGVVADAWSRLPWRCDRPGPAGPAGRAA